jgi:hypothetical protein
MELIQELAALQKMSPAQLRDKYAEVFGEPTRAGHKAYLVRKIAWRLQARAEGDLSARAQRRAEELGSDLDIRMRAPKSAAPTNPGAAAVAAMLEEPVVKAQPSRLPMPGAVLRREYKGTTQIVTILADGFEFNGQRYKSLTAVTTAITGTHWNGYHFFGLKNATNKRSKA